MRGGGARPAGYVQCGDEDGGEAWRDNLPLSLLTFVKTLRSGITVTDVGPKKACKL